MSDENYIKPGDKYVPIDTDGDTVCYHPGPLKPCGLVDGSDGFTFNYATHGARQGYPLFAADPDQFVDSVNPSMQSCGEIALYPIRQGLKSVIPSMKVRAVFVIAMAYPASLPVSIVILRRTVTFTPTEVGGKNVSFNWGVLSIDVPQYILGTFRKTCTLSWTESGIDIGFDWEAGFSYDINSPTIQTFDTGVTNDQWNGGILPPGNPNNTANGFVVTANELPIASYYNNLYKPGEFGPATYGPQYGMELTVLTVANSDTSPDITQLGPIPPD